MEGGFKTVCDEYISVAFSIDNDLQLWKVFLPATIKTYLEKYPEQERALSSGFYAYDIDSNTCKFRDHNFNKSSEIKAQELEPTSQYFLQWVEVLSIVRLYSSIEDLLLHSIIIKYYDNGCVLSKNKRQANDIKNKIREELKSNKIPISRINNRFLIDFLKLKSDSVSNFLKCKTRPEENFSWEGFFEFISIIRHIVVHNGMVVSPDERNNINSKFQEMFIRYFQLVESENGHMILRINEKVGIGNVISMCSDFALNMAKCIFELDTF